MTPNLALAVDPIFLHMLQMLDSIAAGKDLSASDERVRISALLAEADARMGSNPEWDLGRYGLISWIDEMLVEAAWNGREWWSNNVLEVELYNTRNCYELFFVKAKEASAHSQRDALEVFYVCVILGFRGLYDDPEMARSIIQAHGLPENLTTWAQQTAMGIRLGQGRPAMQGLPKSLGGAPPRGTRDRVVWPWLFAAITVSTAVLCWTL
jgi:type VI secretion system protein ImpK